MRITSVNVNGIRATARKGGLEWMAAANADVFAWQEVRATVAQTDVALADSSLENWQRVQAPSELKGRNGVALLTRHPIEDVQFELPGFTTGTHSGRWIAATIALPIATDIVPVRVVNVYMHSGQVDTPRQADKYEYLAAMNEVMLAGDLLRVPTVVVGDFNVAHTEDDIKNWKGNRGKSGFLEDERAYLSAWMDAGWMDSVRSLHGPGPGPYTWWSMRGKAFDNDAGWRIDYQLVSPALARLGMHKFEIARAASYAERWSDHAPVSVDFGSMP